MPATIDEQSFRERYRLQLRSVKNYRELEEELQQVKRQQMRTPGRRGEEIKREEIDQEIVQRLFDALSAQDNYPVDACPAGLSQRVS